MPIFFNGAGLAIVFGALIVVSLLERLVTAPPAMPYAVAGVLAAGLDLGYRLRRTERSLFGPTKGGNLMFVPVWLLGLAACGLAAKTHLRCPTTIGVGLAREEAKARAKLRELDAALDAKADLSLAVRSVSPAAFETKPFVDYPRGRSTVTYEGGWRRTALGASMMHRP